MPAIADPYASHYGAAATSGDTARRLHARLRATLRRSELTRALAEGADPAASPELALRAAQLTSARSRRSARACAAPHDRRGAPTAAGAFPRGDHPARCRARGRRRNQDDDRPTHEPAPGSGAGHGHGRTDPHERGRQPALQPGRARDASAADHGCDGGDGAGRSLAVPRVSPGTMMHRRHFPVPSDSHALGQWSLTLPRWATPPSSADQRSATRGLRGRRRRPRGSAKLMSATRAHLGAVTCL